MSRAKLICASLLFIFAGGLGPTAHAVWSAGELTIIELKMTGSESIVIENTSASTIDLSNYLLQYFNKYNPASLAVPTSTQQLPGFSLPPNQTILLSGDFGLTCGAAAAANLSFSLSDTSGYMMLSRVTTQPDGSLLYSPADHVSWTSSATGADINHVPSNTADPAAVWYRQLSEGNWQKAELSDGCGLLVGISSPADTPTYLQWADGSYPPATISNFGTSIPGIPAADIGLSAPQVNELLPNPASPATDGEDEFIELYNPNSATFDLSGFKLEVGTSTKRSYIFPVGTTIAARSFKAFYSIDTGLAMSNSGSQVRLIDPLGSLISQSDIYSSAKDGQAWAAADGKWYWTAQPTPGAANTVGQSPVSSKTTKSSKTTGTVKGSSVSSPKTPSQNVSETAPVHSWTLAGVGSLALLYAGYEYRADLANNLYRLRRYYQARRDSGR